MGFWWLAGFSVQLLANYISVLLGGEHNVAATVVFVLGLIGAVAGLVMAMAAAASWFWTTLLPGLSQAVLLPLLWLALTATALGWREVSSGEVVQHRRARSAPGRHHRRGGWRSVPVAC